MIGVITHTSERLVACEFFELFKTSWEFYQPDRSYEVLLCVGEEPPVDAIAGLVLIYSADTLRSDAANQVEMADAYPDGRVVFRDTDRIPLYGRSVTFTGERSALLLDAQSERPVAYRESSSGTAIARFGYDLFHEVRILLTKGQPVLHAAIPTLDLHISLLRDIIIASGIPLIEIPPAPEGYRFIACLTHDVDHPSIRHHRFDHTMFGFLYRAVIGCVGDLLRGRVTVRHVLQNWGAALKLPFVHLGLAKDFWQGLDRYVEVEGQGRSSFFVIPFRDEPGTSSKGPAPRSRAAKYGAADIADQLRQLVSANCEVGLHGIDAWRDSNTGCKEAAEIRRITAKQEVGTRMHWLYFDELSPVVLEQAGLDYDSTIGYNEAVGYRAGTGQVYRPLGVERLLELPLHIMDTALFFPSRLNLSRKEARAKVSAIIDNAVRFGGAVTLNWHDRSIAPDRCWGEFYADTLDELRQRGAWLATASDTVAWFRMRRAASPVLGGRRTHTEQPAVRTRAGEELPGLYIRSGQSLESPHVASPGVQACAT
jgi:hypothetical protein